MTPRRKSLVPQNLSEIVAVNGTAVGTYLAKMDSPRSQQTMALALCHAHAIVAHREEHSSYGQAAAYDWMLDQSDLDRVRQTLNARIEAEEISVSWANSILSSVRGAANTAREIHHREALRPNACRDFSHPELSDDVPLDRERYKLLMRTAKRDIRAKDDRRNILPQRTFGMRDAGILAVARCAAPRVAELGSLQLEDYQDGAIAFRKTKGRRAKTVDLPPDAQRAMRDWISIRGDWPGPLFPHIKKDGSIRERGLGPRGLQQMLDRRAKRAGIPPVSWHAFRYLLADELLDQGKPEEAQTVLGHLSLGTTLRYARRGRRRRAAEALKTVPVEY